MYKPQPSVYNPYYLRRVPSLGFASVPLAQEFARTVDGRSHEILDHNDRHRVVASGVGADTVAEYGVAGNEQSATERALDAFFNAARQLGRLEERRTNTEAPSPEYLALGNDIEELGSRLRALREALLA